MSRLRRDLMIHRRLRRTAPASHRLVWLLAFLVALPFGGCAMALVGGGGTAYAVAAITRDLPRPEDLRARPLPQVTQLYDRTGQHLLYEFYEQRRIIVPLKDIAPVMIQATLAAEDVNFYQHGGFDPRGLLRAAWVNFRTGETVQGGSTITQQLVKRMLLSPEKSYARKLRELLLAMQVEQRYSKDQILELYLNEVYYGNQAYGVEAAALTYFGKHARDLNLAEASILAGLVQQPSTYNPVDRLPAALARQAEVLDVMVKNGMVTPEQAEEAKQQAAAMTYLPAQTEIRAPHFSFYIKKLLQEQFPPDVLARGLKVITTLDLNLQERGQEIVRRRVDQIRWQRVNNGALVALSPQTGEILAMVGSYDYHKKEIDGEVNVALALRQPGSSFKLFTYATAFATGKWSPATPVTDQPIIRPDFTARDGAYRPKNYDDRFHGTMTLRQALANSYNIPAVLVQEAVGTREVIKTARAMGITTELPEVRSLTLGAGVVRLLDMTGAYGAVANGGKLVEPVAILRVLDWQDRVLYEYTPPPGRQVISPEVAYLLADVLSDAAARRPMFGTVLDLAGGRIAAVKTGTANDYKDSWTLGFTPYFVTGVWVGNTDNSPMLQVAGSLGAGYIWKEFMDTVLAGLPNVPFTPPPGVVRAPVCPGRRDTDLFIGGTEPKTGCPPPIPNVQQRYSPDEFRLLPLDVQRRVPAELRPTSGR